MSDNDEDVDVDTGPEENVSVPPNPDAVYQHIIVDIFGSSMGGIVDLSLASETMDDFISIVSARFDMIESLTYLDEDDGDIKQLPKGWKNKLHIFKCYFTYRRDNHDAVDMNIFWMNVTRQQFDEFRMSAVCGQMMSMFGTGNTTAPSPSIGKQPNVTTSTNTTTTTAQYSPYSLIDSFKKGIKKDPQIFPEFKDDLLFDEWKRTTESLAVSQDVAEVLNTNYTPSTPEEKTLFDLKSNYMYSVFVLKLRTDKGKSIVREHTKDKDGQAVYKKLSGHYLASTLADIRYSALLSYITTQTISTSNWKGTTEGFILHWVDQLRLLQDVDNGDEDSKFTDRHKRVMLQNAVMVIPELRQVKTQADQMKQHDGKCDLTYDSYLHLLLSAAQAYDSNNASQPANRRLALMHSTVPTPYVINLHEQDQYQYDYHQEPSFDFDIDTPVSVISAYAAQHRTRSSQSNRSNGEPQIGRLDLEVWTKLSRDERKAWTTLSPATRELIIKGGVKSTMSAMQHEYVQADDNQESQDVSHDNDQRDDVTVDTPDFLLSAMKANTTSKKASVKTHDIRRVLSKTMAEKPKTVTYNVEVHVVYNVSAHHSSHDYSLIDRGANGGIAGEDVRVITKTQRSIDIQGIDNHQLKDVPIVTAGGVIKTQFGDMIAIFHQYGYTGKGSTIHSSAQLEFFKNEVSDRAVKNGGTQRIVTLDGYIIPISIKNGLPRIHLRPYTDDEWETLPHVVMTSDVNWDPSVVDYNPYDDDTWFQSQPKLSDGSGKVFDEFGNLKEREFSGVRTTNIDDITDYVAYRVMTGSDHEQVHEVSTPSSVFIPEARNKSPNLNTIRDDESSGRNITQTEPKYDELRPQFGWLSSETIKKTFKATTQYGQIPQSTMMKKHFKSPFPALNVHRRNEDVATDVIYSDTPAVDSGATAAQVFVGCSTKVITAFGCKTDKEFINTLEDEIRRRGAPNRLVSDSAKALISAKVLQILRALHIGDWQSEPHHQHQNPAERRIQVLKSRTNAILDRTGAPRNTWLLCVLYVCYLLNHTHCLSINDVPMRMLTGSTPDISILMRFKFWEEVYYKLEDTKHFPSESREAKGNFVGFSEHVGHAMTYKILTQDTKKILHRSTVRPVTQEDSNLHLANKNGEDDGGTKEPDQVVRSVGIDPNDDTTFNPVDLIGKSFLMIPLENGERRRATIIEYLEDRDAELDNNPIRKRFKCKVGPEKFEEIMTYAQVMDYIRQDDQSDIVWKFKRIVGHQGPMKPSDPNYKGSRYNVQVEWENGEIDYHPLKLIASDDPISCALYAKEHDLLNEAGWKQLKSYVRNEKKMLRLINQAKLRSYRHAPKYMFGYEIPRDYDHAARLDAENKCTRWQDCTDLELEQLDEYKTFEDRGRGVQVPTGYRKIRVHLVYAVKHDGRHKARMVADGHLTEVPLESVYSGVVSLRGLRIVTFIAELNGLLLWSTDVGNAYLESMTEEKVCFIAGSEFGKLAGHLLVIKKALYGLRSSGKQWHDRLFDALFEMGFQPSKAEPDIWMKEVDGLYEYVAVYVDDLAIASKNPKAITDYLEGHHKFKLKGTGPIGYHLGMDFFRDDDGVLCVSPKKYIKKMVGTYEQLFGQKPNVAVRSPLEKGDHPELDDTDLLEENEIVIYQSLIGALQWAISIGRFDIQTAVMSLSSFRVAPRKGHLDRVKRVYGYLCKMNEATIRVRTEVPDYSDLPSQVFDWSRSVYGETTEDMPHDAPVPRGKTVRVTHYVDANLMHDVITGKSVTGILHLLNQTPIDWYAKKQATIETATYGSEFVAARTCVEQSVDIRNTLRYLGVPVENSSYMFGDNKAVVDSSVRPHSTLHKRHTILSFHRVRQAIACGYIKFFHIPGHENPSDILSKHWGYTQIWDTLRPLLFWSGDTADLIDDG